MIVAGIDIPEEDMRNITEELGAYSEEILSIGYNCNEELFVSCMDSLNDRGKDEPYYTPRLAVVCINVSDELEEMLRRK